MKFTIFLAGLLLTAFSTAWADERLEDGIAEEITEKEPLAGLSTTEEAFSLPLAEADRLLREVRTDALRYARLREMLREGRASLKRMIVQRGASGQRAVTLSVHERRYFTEYPPPPIRLLADFKNITFPFNPTTPTMFNTRNVGDCLELEPVLMGDEVSVDLNLIPQIVHYVGERLVNLDVRATQPIFETSKITTSVTLRDGQPYLLGTLNPAGNTGVVPGEKEPRVWLDFLTVKVLRLERGPTTPTEARARAMRLPQVDLRGASISEAVDFLQKQSVALDPKKEGLNFGWRASSPAKVTLQLTDVSLYDAARYVAGCANLVLVSEGAVLLMRPADEK